MGVSGCGKTTLGKHFAKKYGWRFIDADKFHSKANIAKMSEGIPLNDEDRFPWLLALYSVIKSWEDKGASGILACSALKESYRNLLINGKTDENNSAVLKKVLLVHLKGDKDVISQRLSSREGHFMREKLIDSQFEALEEPDCSSPNTLSLSIENSVEDNADIIVQTLLEVFDVKV